MAERRFDPPLDRRAVLRGLLLGAAGVAGAGAVAACGLPSTSRPIVDGPGLSGHSGTGDTLVNPPVPEDAFDQVGLVQKFFGAVAGRLRLDADITKADERAQAFLTPRARQAWQGGGQVTVVRRLTQETPSAGGGGEIVEVEVQPIGVLARDGTVAPLPPSVTTDTRTLQFTVIPNGGRSRYLIDQIDVTSGSPLTGMMLYSSNLMEDSNLYLPQLIYFWSSDTQPRGLVPDLRYLPRAGLSQESQVTEIVDWVLTGASDLIKDQVQDGAYSGISIIGPNLTTTDHDALLINLNNRPQGIEPKDVMAQLRWSLRPVYSGTVQLQYNSQPQATDGSSAAYRDVNLADEKYRAPQVEFCVAGGVVHNVDDPTNPPDVLSDPTFNKDVSLAAVHRSLQVTALVKTDRQLHIGDARGPGKPGLTVAQLLPSQGWTRPAFLPVSDPLVLVGREQKLYLVTPDGKANQLVTGFPVSAFAVAPDGHRIGMISNGAILVCGMKIGQDGKISLGSPRQIDAGLTDYSGIAWSRLDRVLVAGKSRSNNNYPLAEVSIDGAIVEQWRVPFVAPVTSVVALPQLPWDSPESGPAMVQANGAWKAFSTHNDGLSLDVPTPTPSASGAPTTPSPQNPFYVD